MFLTSGYVITGKMATAILEYSRRRREETPMRQIVTASADGAVATMSAFGTFNHYSPVWYIYPSTP